MRPLPHPRAEAYRWILFAVTELEQPLWRIARHTVLYPEGDRLAGDVPLAQREFRDMAIVLEHHMSGRTFVAGERTTPDGRAFRKGLRDGYACGSGSRGPRA